MPRKQSKRADSVASAGVARRSPRVPTTSKASTPSPGIRRLLHIAMLDALGLENSVARSRALTVGALAAARLLEVGELEERLQAVEASLGPRMVSQKRRR